MDSITVSDAEVNDQVERNIQFFAQEYGVSPNEVHKKYGFNDLDDMKKNYSNVNKETMLVQREQSSITEDIDVTPEEVRIYYNGLKKKGELPEFPAEIQLAQLVVNAAPTQEENDRIINKLLQIKKEIEDGSSIRMKAIINSDDPGVTQNGGRYTITKNSPFIKEFKETAFSLDIGQVSEPIKSMFGYPHHSATRNQRRPKSCLSHPHATRHSARDIKCSKRKS